MMLHQKWFDKIVKEVEFCIDGEFPKYRTPYVSEIDSFERSTSGGVVTQIGEIDPFLFRFLTFMNIYIERQLLDKVKESMEEYLRFILQFMAR